MRNESAALGSIYAAWSQSTPTDNGATAAAVILVLVVAGAAILLLWHGGRASHPDPKSAKRPLLTELDEQSLMAEMNKRKRVAGAGYLLLLVGVFLPAISEAGLGSGSLWAYSRWCAMSLIFIAVACLCTHTAHIGDIRQSLIACHLWIFSGFVSLAYVGGTFIDCVDELDTIKRNLGGLRGHVAKPILGLLHLEPAWFVLFAGPLLTIVAGRNRALWNRTTKQTVLSKTFFLRVDILLSSWEKLAFLLSPPCGRSEPGSVCESRGLRALRRELSR